MIDPKKCKHNPMILCGVVRNTKNCPFNTEDQCNDDNAEAWLGIINRGFNTLTLKRFRYNHKRIKVKILDVNMCSECKVIWADPMNCPICNGDDET